MKGQKQEFGEIPNIKQGSAAKSFQSTLVIVELLLPNTVFLFHNIFYFFYIVKQIGLKILYNEKREGFS
jgi:hypothetical protein